MDEELFPSISAANRLQKIRCKCCLIGFHPPEQCYIRGLQFLPTKLRQRVMLFNKQHGDKPPPGTKPKEWNPRSIPAIHSDKKKVRFDKKGGLSNPFKNTATKVKTTDPSVSSLLNEQQEQQDEDEIIEEIIQDLDTTDPSYSAFILQQESQAATYTMQDMSNDDEFQAVGCSFVAKDIGNIQMVMPIICSTQQIPSNNISFQP